MAGEILTVASRDNRFSIGIKTATSRGHGDLNHDAGFVDPRRGIVALFDGLGSAPASEKASSVARDNFAVWGSCGIRSGSRRERLAEMRTALLAPNDLVASTGGRATGLIVSLHGESEHGAEPPWAGIAGFGHGIAALLAGGTLTHLLPDDRSLAQGLDRDSALTLQSIPSGKVPDQLQAYIPRGRVLHALGDTDHPLDEHVQTLPVNMPPSALLLVATDGLHKQVNDPEVVHVLTLPGLTNQQRADRLVALAQQSPNPPDDVTVAVVGVTEAA